jgi:hypothetical protein
VSAGVPRVFVTRAPEAAAGEAYTFKGAMGRTHWPMEDGRGLGQTGAFNAFLRMGFLPVECPLEQLPRASTGDVVSISASAALSNASVERLRQWTADGGIALAGGLSASWSAFLPGLQLAPFRKVHPYGAFAFVLDGRAELLLPPQWSMFKVTGRSDGTTRLGQLALAHGERQTPARALLTPLPDCPALVAHGGFFLLNGDPFAAFQAWLQGQEDLQPWIAWRHRLFWLDEWVGFMRSMLVRAGALPEREPPGVAALPRTTVVLRHDLDDSSDDTYLSLEDSAGVRGVHAVLKDANTSYWRERLARAPGHESAFHYNSGRSPRARNLIRRKLRRPPMSYLPARSEIAGSGLLEQVRWAKRNRVGIGTLHRHLTFLYYPEYVDALDAVFANEPGVLGASSYFRCHLLRWGADRCDGARGTYAEFPDAQFPYWFPFRLAHAANGGRMLSGWESASVMEIEPGLVDQMLRHRVPGLAQRVLILNFHPAHANKPTFAADGSVEWFRGVLDLLREAGVEVMTLEQVFQALNEVLAAEPARHGA